MISWRPWRLGGSFLAIVTLLGCGGGAVVAPLPSARPLVRASAEPPMPDPGTFVSKRFGVRMPLPSGTSWKIDDTTTRWLSATQPAEDATLLFRMWRDDNNMTREKCEERARLSKDLPSRTGAEIVEQRRIDVPSGFDTQVDIALMPNPKGQGLYGLVLAFGGYSHKCFAYVYVTHAAGPGADRKVGERLAKMVEGSLSRLTFETDFDVRLERDTTAVLY